MRCAFVLLRLIRKQAFNVEGIMIGIPAGILVFLCATGIAGLLFVMKYVSFSWYWTLFLMGPNAKKFGIFRNKPGVKPGRWGFYVLGFEVGSRNPGDPVGLLLKRWGLWPW